MAKKKTSPPETSATVLPPAQRVPGQSLTATLQQDAHAVYVSVGGRRYLEELAKTSPKEFLAFLLKFVPTASFVHVEGDAFDPQDMREVARRMAFVLAQGGIEVATHCTVEHETVVPQVRALDAENVLQPYTPPPYKPEPEAKPDLIGPKPKTSFTDSIDLRASRASDRGMESARMHREQHAIAERFKRRRGLR